MTNFWRGMLFSLLALASGAVMAQSGDVMDPRFGFRPPRLVVPEAQFPIRLDSVKIEAEAHGNQAITRVELVFFNPNLRVLEGELQFPLLAGQQIIGMAMDMDGKLRDAVPVEKAKGQEIFEEVTRQKVDPALLEVTQGNNYKLRVYPIPANGYKRIVLRLQESLPVRDKNIVLRLPLNYADKLPQFDLSLKVFGAEQRPVAVGGKLGAVLFAQKGEIYEAKVNRSNFSGQGVLEVRVPAPTRANVSTQTWAEQTYFRAEIPLPAIKPVARALPKKMALYWDASGSGAQRDKVREYALLDRYFKAMGNGEVSLVVFRDAPEAAQTFTISNGNWAALKAKLEGLAYDGATSFGGLEKVAGAQEALLFSDGLQNFRSEALPSLGLPVFAISSAVSANPASLRLLAERSGGRLIDLQRLTETEAVQRLLMHTTELVELGGTGVTQVLAESRWADDGRFLIAGMVPASGGKLRVVLAQPGKKTSGAVEITIPPSKEGGSLAALTWARFKLAELEGEYALKKGEIRRLGQLFRLPTRETSLIILDTPQDYARYEIEPPPELAAQVEQLRVQKVATDTRGREEHLSKIVRQFEEKQKWWNKDFPKDTRPTPAAIAKGDPEDRVRLGAIPEARPAPRPAMASPSVMAEASADGFGSGRVMAKKAARNGGAVSAGEDAAPVASITLKKWTSDAPYIRRLQDAAAGQLYAVYLDEKPSWQNSSAFYLDVADALFDKGQPELAVRVLSNLAEMNLENRALLRILGYRLMQAKQPKLAIPVFEKIRDLAPNEPQSYRDLGLAYAADSQMQKAVDALWEVVSKPWHGRFPEVELITLAELNALIATAPGQLDTSRIDPRLKKNLPLDLRVILTWDADNSDMDLWVTDPNGEKSFYGNRLSYQGGRMSPDFTGGYGPEEYSLKNAKPGKYLVQANFYGHRQQVVAGATTLQLKLQTGFGTAQSKEEIITLRLKGKSEVVTVGEFEVRE
ncbi:MAG: yfaP [Proteobacteria bacterium]|nr:yfaP [Pseudomonadota bacterium]